MRVGVLDLGSSSFHALVAEVRPPARAGGAPDLERLARDRELLHLGTVVAEQGTVPARERAAARAVATRLGRFIRSLDADRCVGYGTAALRSAANGAEVAAELSEASGVPIKILDGRGEAELVFTGQVAGSSFLRDLSGDEPWLSLDLGGGSLEIGFARGNDLEWAMSVEAGVAALYGLLRPGDPLGAPERAQIGGHVAATLAPVVERLSSDQRLHGSLPAVASGGTVRAISRLSASQALASAPELHGAGAVETHGMEMSLASLLGVDRWLAGASLADRRSHPDIPERRAELLPVGTAILRTAVAALRIDHLVVSDWGLREGAALAAAELVPAPGLVRLARSGEELARSGEETLADPRYALAAWRAI